MSRNHYAEINLHLVWHTKQSRPLLTPEVEACTHRYLRGRLINTPGAFVHEVGGIETHVHVVVSVVPTMLVGELVGQLKGASSHEADRQFGPGRKVLEWQDGYGVVSFGHQGPGLGEGLRAQPARAPCPRHDARPVGAHPDAVGRG